MAEGRMIKKRISISKKFAALKTDSARLLYLMMYPHSDVEGRLEADVDYVQGVCIPRLKWKDQKVLKCLDDLDRVGLIVIYEVNNNKYLQIIRFNDFQILRKDREANSQIEPPPAELLELRRSSPPEVKISKDKLSKDKDKLITSQIEDLLPLFPDNIQKDIKIYWDRARTQNKSGVITDGRRLTLLLELYNSMQLCNDIDTFHYGLEQAISHDAPCIGYVNKVIKTRKTKRPG